MTPDERDVLHRVADGRLERPTDKEAAVVAQCAADMLDSLASELKTAYLDLDEAERSLDAARGEAAGYREALGRIAVEVQCGCVPCVGQCTSWPAMQCEFDGRVEVAREALALPLPEAVKIAAAEREKAEALDWIIENHVEVYFQKLNDGYSVWIDGNNSWEAETALAALKAARGAA